MGAFETGRAMVEEAAADCGLTVDEVAGDMADSQELLEFLAPDGDTSWADEYSDEELLELAKAQGWEWPSGAGR